MESSKFFGSTIVRIKNPGLVHHHIIKKWVKQTNSHTQVRVVNNRKKQKASRPGYFIRPMVLLLSNPIRKKLWSQEKLVMGNKLIYSPFSLTWLMTYDFQVEFFSFNYQKQWKLSVCKKVINQVRLNEVIHRLYYMIRFKMKIGTGKSCLCLLYWDWFSRGSDFANSSPNGNL